MVSKKNDVRTLPLLRRVLFELVDDIRASPEYNESKFTLLSQVKLTTVIEPNGKGFPITKKQKTALLCGTVDLIICTPPPNSKPIIIIDLSDAKNKAQAAFLRPLIEDRGIGYFFIDVRDLEWGKRQETVDRVVSRVLSGSQPKGIRESINWSQNETVESLMPLSVIDEGLPMVLLQEVALDAVVRAPENWWKLIGIQKPANAQYLNQTSVDLLIASEPPNSTPIMGVEFDGPIHDGPKQSRKDKIKDALFIAAGVPLIRVSGKNIDGKFRREFLLYFASELSFLVNDSWWKLECICKNLFHESEILKDVNLYHSKNINKYAEEVLGILENKKNEFVYYKGLASIKEEEFEGLSEDNRLYDDLLICDQHPAEMPELLSRPPGYHLEFNGRTGKDKVIRGSIRCIFDSTLRKYVKAPIKLPNGVAGIDKIFIAAPDYLIANVATITGKFVKEKAYDTIRGSIRRDWKNIVKQFLSAYDKYNTEQRERRRSRDRPKNSKE